MSWRILALLCAGTCLCGCPVESVLGVTCDSDSDCNGASCVNHLCAPAGTNAGSGTSGSSGSSASTNSSGTSNSSASSGTSSSSASGGSGASTNGSGTSSSSASGGSSASTNSSGTSSSSGSGATSSSSGGSSGSTGIGVFGVSGDLDFGLTPCGRTAAAQQITVSNTGSGAFTITALSLSKAASSPFSVSASSMTVPAHGQVTITVTPLAAPATVPSLPADLSDSLVITTDIPRDSPHLVHLQQGVAGSILAFDTSSIPFGRVPVSAMQSSTFKVMNNGNLDAHVTLSTDNGVFTVSPDTQQVVTTALNAAVTFAPTDTTPQQGTVELAVDASDALCQPLPAGIALSGTGQNGGLAIDASSLDFGLVNCGATALPQSFTMTNVGNAPLSYTAQLGKSPSPYAMACPPGAGSSCIGTGGLNGSLAPDQAVTISVTPAAIPTEAATSPDLFADQVTINTNVIGDVAHFVALHETAKGVVLDWGEAAVDVGSVPVGQSGSTVFQIVNRGNVAATVALASDNPDFAVATPASVPGGASPSFNATFTPSVTAPESANVSMSDSTDILCGPLPGSPLAVSGTGTATAVGVSPSSLNFNGGQAGVYCGAQASAQTVTITNGTNADLTFGAALLGGASSPYTIDVSSGVAAANGGTATITVTPKPIPSVSAVPGAYGDTLEITSDVPGDSAHDIALLESARGAIVTRAGDTLAFPDAPAGGQSIAQLAITNSGNDPAQIVWGTPTNTVFVMNGITLAASTTLQDSNAFRPTNAQPYSGTVSMGVSGSTVLCQPLPAVSVGLSGTGTNQPLVTLSQSSLDWAQVSCNASPPSKQIVISNSATSSVDFTTSLANPNGFANPQFTVSPASGTIPANGTQTLTITPATIVTSAATSTAPNYYGDSLGIDITGGVTTTLSVALLETARGVALTWSPASVSTTTILGSPTATSSLRNGGNVNATVSLTLSDTTNYTLTPTSGTTTTTTPLGVTVKQTRGLGVGPAASVTVNPGSSPVCTPLPTLAIN